MSKPNNPNRNQAEQRSGIHSQIASEAAKLRNATRATVRDADETPALSSLLDSARAALDRSIPARFDHEGKTYYLRVSVGMARLIIFDLPTAPEPLVTALSGSVQEFGHTPCH